MGLWSKQRGAVSLKPVALDLAIMKRSIEQLAGGQDQLARKQDQMTQAFATLQAAEQDIKQNILALAPLAPKAALVPPSNPSHAAAQYRGHFNILSLRDDKGDRLRNVFLELLADGEPAVIISLRVAAIASVMAAVACTPVMAQTTGTIPP